MVGNLDQIEILLLRSFIEEKSLLLVSFGVWKHVDGSTKHTEYKLCIAIFAILVSWRHVMFWDWERVCECW